ncbi:adenylate/guanylate cyclase domain-containing protein [Nitrincola alkalilacustris]|uniref:adenylate/guanylate cyclase domain-containing protein n=1 Tax=Nitrincola alkalilacustris TaxID=1571224 RepID=UPI00124DFB4B|nr:adenylate/guanylate cyclase domain-containing protein [Nitrincola alkalilacustris]
MAKADTGRVEEHADPDKHTFSAYLTDITSRGLCLALFLAALQLSGAGQRIEHIEFDLLTLLTAPAPPDSGVVVAGLDDPSFLELNLSPPLPRSLHAKLIDMAAESGVSVLGFDLLFSEPQNEADDRSLGTALARADTAGPAVILAGAEIHLHTSQVQAYTQRLLPIFPDATVGMVNHLADSDGAVRRILTDENSFWYRIAEASDRDFSPAPPRARLRYYAPEIRQPYIHFTQALNPQEQLPPNALTNTLLLIGMNTPVSGLDQFSTPFGDKQISGVFLHATALNNALADDWIALQPWWYNLVLTLLLLAIILISTVRWTPGRAALITLALILLSGIFSVWRFDAGQWWLLWPAVLGLLFLYNLDAARNYWKEWRRREQIRRLFSSYVPPTLVNRLTRQGSLPVLSGERRELTLLFSDLAGFTAANERMPPEDVASALNAYFSAMTDIIHQHGGTLDKFIGDAVMAFWNAPLDQPEHATLALNCASAMQREMVRLRQNWQGTPFGTLKLRIGIHTGEAAVGNLGSVGRFTYTAVGDAVNTAARLEAANKATGSDILLSRATASRLDTRSTPPLAWLDRLRVAGKDDAIDVYTPVELPEIAALSLTLLQRLEAGDLESALGICKRWAIILAESMPVLSPQADRLNTRIEALRKTHPSNSKVLPDPVPDFSRAVGK